MAALLVAAAAAPFLDGPLERCCGIEISESDLDYLLALHLGTFAGYRVAARRVRGVQGGRRRGSRLRGRRARGAGAAGRAGAEGAGLRAAGPRGGDDRRGPSRDARPARRGPPAAVTPAPPGPRRAAAGKGFRGTPARRAMGNPAYARNEIICADAADLCERVEPESVTLTVTSPPYRNAIDYSRDVDNARSGSKEWMRGVGTQTTAAYLGAMGRIFGQVFGATRDGGYCCIVVGDEVVDGKLIPLPSLLASGLAGRESVDDPEKWRLRDVIVWHKATSGRNGAGNRFGMFVRLPYPGYFRANIMHEYILVLQKGGRGATSRSEADRVPVNRVAKRELANSVWNIPPVPPLSASHPAPFPEQIPWRLITLLSARGDLVLDPMNGSGQTTKMARHLGRDFVGMDVRQEYVDLARRRLAEEPRPGAHLIPVFHKEAWSVDDQAGFFETEEADLSANMPAGYSLRFTSAEGGGGPGIRAHYENGESSHMCLVLSAAGRQVRLNLGRLEDGRSLLRRVLDGLPPSRFTAGAAGEAIETRMAGKRQAALAALDVLEERGLVAGIGGKGAALYELTEAGRSARRGIAGGRPPAAPGPGAAQQKIAAG